ncbi:MAG: hypothetical protein IJ905_14700 [Fibrobacter sp.]|nr:hypothetical protein [Fibrobacter sp.]
MILLWVLVSVAVALFAVFPLTDTDIWWHLACAREWVTTWTPVREPVVNVHEFFQQSVAFVYNIGGAPLLVAFKAASWGGVFALFLWPARHRSAFKISAIIALILFVFRFHFEMRPVVFSLVFLGFYWNVLPWLFDEIARVDEKNHCCDSRLKCLSGTERKCSDRIHKVRLIAALLFLLVLQWVWCKCQGLYILGPIFATLTLCSKIFATNGKSQSACTKKVVLQTSFVLLLFAMPFFHREGWDLFLYPFGLLDRLLGTSPSAAIFASEIAENRSPFTLLMAGENVLESVLMVALCFVGIFVSVVKLCRADTDERSKIEELPRTLWFVMTAILVLIAERNFVLFLPVLIAAFISSSAFFSCFSSLAFRFTRLTHLHFVQHSSARIYENKFSCITRLASVCRLSSIVLIAFLLGLWVKSLSSYDSAIAYQRVPVAATEWMKAHPHQGRLFNDDRAGGYLAFMNPSDSIFIDGRFMLKTADFFERYLKYSESPQLFLHDADSLNIGRVVLPLRYYARWNKLIVTLDSVELWHIAYQDSFFVVIDRKNR